MATRFGSSSIARSDVRLAELLRVDGEFSLRTDSLVNLRQRNRTKQEGRQLQGILTRRLRPRGGLCLRFCLRNRSIRSGPHFGLRKRNRILSLHCRSEVAGTWSNDPNFGGLLVTLASIPLVTSSSSVPVAP